MDQFAWLSELEQFSPAALTVRAQTISPNDNGRLLWDAFMPRFNAPSIRLAEGSAPIFRPTADRREWNQRGRYIPMITPRMREMVMVPIESTNRIDEEEMQYLFERFGGGDNIPQALFRQTIQASIPERVQTIVEADYRRIELDTFEAWANGRIVQKDPQTGELTTASFGFDASRYQVAGTAWDVATDAYANFIAFLRDASDAFGGVVAGAMMRDFDLQVIQADAPTPMTGIPLNRSQLQDQISQDLGQAFRFYVNERTVHQFNDGGTAYTQVKVWPAGHIAAVPAGEEVGRVHFAPVVRAIQLAAAVPAAQIDVRGVTITYESANGGRELIIEGQVNAMPVPNEQRMFVVETGVTYPA